MADNDTSGTTEPEELLMDSLQETSRPTGLLTQRQREYILNFDEFTGQQERSIRYRIRERLHHGLLDLILLNRFMPPPGEWKSTLDSNADLPPDELIFVLTQLGYYFAHFADEEDYREHRTDSPSKFFEKQVESGVSVAEAGFRGEDPSVQKVDVDVDITHDDFNEDTLFAKIVSEEASSDELWAYLSHGDQDRLVRFLEQGDREVSIYDPSKEAYNVVTAVDGNIQIEFVATAEKENS